MDINGSRHSGHGGGHVAHHRMMIMDFRRRFYVSLFATIPVLILSDFIQNLLHYSLIIPGSRYIVFTLSTFIYFYGGWPFLKGFKDELSKKLPGMMTLIAVAISVAYAYSGVVTFGFEGTPFYWELATLIDIMLAGHWIEMRSVVSASAALEKLAGLMPDIAHRKTGDAINDVPLKEIKKDDVIVVKPGEKIPSDGIVVAGTGYVNESMLTGEARPVKKGEGDRLVGGSLNDDASFEMRVSGTGEDSYLAKVVAMVRDAQAEKSRTQALSDKAAMWLTIIAIAVGITTLIAWLLSGRGLQFSIARMATVMVITCPHALGLAIPLVAARSTALSARNGLLIRNRTAFENSRKITTVLFDKTGTLTKGSFEVSDVAVYDGAFDERSVIGLAAALETQSGHPIAKGIVEKAKAMGVRIEPVSQFREIKGRGVEGSVDGRRVIVAGPGYLKETGLQEPGGGEKSTGETRVFLIADDKPVGSIALSDAIRPESRKAIKKLKDRGIECLMMTGDNRWAAEKVSGELGMDGFFAEVLPDQKLEKVRELQERGEYVAVTGDGVNDAPALAQAQVGIAVGSGTDVAAETADIVLVNNNPLDVAELILFGRATYRKMVQNLVWATGYNVVAIPLAAGVLYGAGFVLSPEIGALLMSLSTVVVAVNAGFIKIRKD
ncbi:MAG: cadmium-translocating P-type ATPase [Spirochaetales bacterium]|nr:cadmium-translocating P-type ATPase [Spirochaetales bacterium]